MELEPSTTSYLSMISSDYIIPIWNWSLYHLYLPPLSILITLFLYGIGAVIVPIITIIIVIITLFLYGIGAV